MSGWRASSPQRVWAFFAAAVFIAVESILLAVMPSVSAVGLLVQSQTAVSNNARTLSVTLAAAAKPTNLIVVVCAANATSTMSLGTTGFSTAAPSAGTTVSQAIFYKVAAGGETTVTCNSSTRTRLGAQIYEYNGVLTAAPFDGTATASGTTGTAVTTGSFTTTTANSLVFGAYVAGAGTAYTVTTIGATERQDFILTAHFGGADRMTTTVGSYSIAATNNASAAWRGQLAVFKLRPIVLAADIVDSVGAPVGSPSASFSSANFGFGCQTVTATLGVAAQKLFVSNTTATPGWALSIAATDGPTASWVDAATNKYDYNDSGGSGCSDGGDADATVGQLTVNPTTSVITPATNCTTTGITRGSTAAFSEGSVNSVTIATGGATAGINCSWTITGVSLSQTIPAEQVEGTYSIGLTITLIAQ